MKTRYLLPLSAGLALVLAGCGTLHGDLRKAIPECNWEEFSATITGKFSSTKISAAGVVKRGEEFTARELHVRHSNAWVPLIEIDATGYKSGPKPAAP